MANIDSYWMVFDSSVVAKMQNQSNVYEKKSTAKQKQIHNDIYILAKIRRKRPTIEEKQK